jgi:hypothetical protein
VVAGLRRVAMVVAGVGSRSGDGLRMESVRFGDASWTLTNRF